MALTKDSKSSHVSHVDWFACMLIRVYDITYIAIQFNHSKLSNFISSWKMVKNTTKRSRWFFLRETDKKMKRKPGVKCFVYLRVWRHLRWIKKLCNFRASRNSTQIPQKFAPRSFSIKLRKLCYKKRGEVLASGPL